MHQSRVALVTTLVAAVAAPGGVARPQCAAAQLPFYYDLYTFRGADGGTAIITTFAVEAGRLETENADGRRRYRFSLTLVLADTLRRTVSKTHDTVYVDVQRRLPDAHLLYAQVEVTAPPSPDTRHRVIVMDAVQPGSGQLYTEPFPIPDYSGSSLMLSDIVLARPGTEDGWKRGDFRLAILPSTRFPPDVFDIYYEIYNLPEGHAYTTEITVERSDPKADPIRLRFSGESHSGPDGLLPEFRRVDAQLARGAHRLTVKVTDVETGKVATRSRSFLVQGSARSATWVQAIRRAHFHSGR